MWIFAYGSLVFRPAFAHVERRRAWVRGWARRFWQGSPDHRGVPAAPGRVVTLVRDARATCGGVAYRIDPDRAPEVLVALDVREVAGFERVHVPVHHAPDAPDDEAFAEALVYVAGPENPHFLGPLDEHAIASWIAKSHGPSGPNADYALSLHGALTELGIEDDHVARIAALLRSRSLRPIERG
ncbi:MAG: gamma-glutamylcyclotransferase [Labilithrix sp.]|nr:gamma-glutamylcyclotransferase [Labilithrix sp.]